MFNVTNMLMFQAAFKEKMHNILQPYRSALKIK